MARYGWDDIDLIALNGHDVQLMVAFELELPAWAAVVDEFHGAGEEYSEKAPTGRKTVDGPIRMRMPFDDAVTTGSAAVFFGSHIANGVFTVGTQGNALGRELLACVVNQMAFAKQPEPDGVTKLEAELDVSGALHQMKLVMPRATVTADGNTQGASLDNSAASSNGGVAALVVKDVDLDGGSGFLGKIQHSVDDAVWSDLATFTSVTAARSSQLVTVAAGATVNRYLSALYDFEGTPGAGATATPLFAFVRN